MFFCIPDAGAGGACHDAADMPGADLVVDFDFSRLDLMSRSGETSVLRVRPRSPRKDDPKFELVSTASLNPTVDQWSATGDLSSSIYFPGPVFNTSNCRLHSTGSIAAETTKWVATSPPSCAEDPGGNRNGVDAFLVMRGNTGGDSGDIIGWRGGGRHLHFGQQGGAWNTGAENTSGGGSNVNFAAGSERAGSNVAEYQANQAGGNAGYVARFHASGSTNNAGSLASSVQPIAMGTTDNFFLGCRYWHAGAAYSIQYQGYIRRVIIFNRLLTRDERRRVGAYLRFKYGCL